MMTPEERVAKCLSQCMDNARAKVSENRNLVAYFPLYRAMVTTENAMPDLFPASKDN